jgi:hypothetical protein
MVWIRRAYEKKTGPIPPLHRHRKAERCALLIVPRSPRAATSARLGRGARSVRTRSAADGTHAIAPTRSGIQRGGQPS